jgi:transcriptional pleiotropic regulator of transition state genes
MLEALIQFAQNCKQVEKKGVYILKSTGIVRNIDQLGRICLPKEARRNLGLHDFAPIEIYIEGDKIILKKYNPGCTFCGSMDKLFNFGGQNICGNCRDEIRRRL